MSKIKKENLKIYLEKFGRLYSKDLGINLEKKSKNFLNGFWLLFCLEQELEKILPKELTKPFKNIIS